jgi:hypothetical protein
MAKLKPKDIDGVYRNSIIGITKPIEYVDKYPSGQSIRFLSDEIINGKRKLSHNSVDFMVAKLLDKKGNALELTNRDYLNIYVVGKFRSDFVPIIKVAEALAGFYIEMKILPNLISLTKNEILSDKRVLEKLRNGILIYDRERSIH